MDGDGGSGGGPPGDARGEVGSLSLPTALQVNLLVKGLGGRKKGKRGDRSALTLRGNAVVLREKKADQSEL